MSITAMKIALEALQGVATWVEQRPNPHPWDSWQRVQPAITALRQALAEPEQSEPVAWMVYTLDGKSVCLTDNPADFTPEHRALPLFTSPLARKWVGLTDEEIDLLEELYAPPVHPDFVNDADHCLELIRHVEAKLKEKNGC